ncbi:hypothetical protein WJ60_09930 [Burkholderia ubonensis]|nr:hypothetical protein WJ60_09930 [Burkholderia ubonensis]
MTDEQIIERCKAAGIKWIPPELPDDIDYEIGFPGAFDMVNMSEMRALLAGSPVEQPAAAPAIELSSVKETLESGGGFWRTCSGCHESEDGHPVGEYPYSEVLQCDLGAGCTECGGIGAVWDNTDYDDMAAFLDRQEEAAEASQSAATPADERAAFIEAYVRTLPPENRAVDPGAAHRFAESVIEACGPGWQLWLAGIAYARAASANETGAEDLDGLAHELWSAAQTQPRQLEGIEDGVRRIKAILSHSPAMAAEAVATRVEWDQDAAIEALSDFPKGSIWYEFLEQAGFDPTSGPIYVLTVQGRAMLDQLKSAYFAAPQPSAQSLQPEPGAELPRFPVVLRKMWSGGEVQRWIDENIAPLRANVALDEQAWTYLHGNLGTIESAIALAGATGHSSQAEGLKAVEHEIRRLFTTARTGESR